MSRNGSGTYSLPAGNPVVTGTVISTTWANNTMNDIASALTGSVASDGQTPMTGPLNLNSNKITNLADPTLAQDAATKNYTDNAISTAGSAYLAKASNLSDVASASTSRTNLGLGSIATQAASSVTITGGSITGITDLAVADGGTGASSFTANNVLLGNGTSSFQTVAPSTAGNVLTSNGTTWTSSANTQYVKVWVNFDGTGTPAIREDFNVSSITDNGTGDYTVNFTNSLTDANYSASVTSGGFTTTDRTILGTAYALATSSVKVNAAICTNAAYYDPTLVSVAIFR